MYLYHDETNGGIHLPLLHVGSTRVGVDTVTKYQKDKAERRRKNRLRKLRMANPHNGDKFFPWDD